MDQGSREELADRIRMIKLYTVHDGKSINRILGPEQLRAGNIEVEGYVTGILVLANVEMKIKVDGQNMSKIRKNQDGTYSIKYYGNVGSTEIGLAPSNNYYQKGSGENNGSQFFLEGYSLFPKVIGDSVSPNCRFDIALETGGSSCDLAVLQNGYSTFQQMNREGGVRDNAIECLYLGEKLNRYLQKPEFQERLNAIAEGIGSVERAFQMKLVDQIKIIDYEKVHNAVTCEEQNEIWFYINTFWEEPLDELKTIAEHETLHILVDRKRLAKDFSIRELFSDLKGYDSLSRERFALVTRGVAPSSGDQEHVSHQEFFAFINEKNFLPGMKGGHSGQNLDEFCASFLHSLMSVNHLQEVLRRPLRVEGEGWHFYPLDSEKRQEILDTYIRTIEAMMGTQPREDSGSFPDGLHTFLAGCLRQAQNLPPGS